MRRQIVELLEPTIQKMTEDREQASKFKNKFKIFKKKVKKIETLLGFGKEKSGWMEDIEKKLLEANLKISEIEDFAQKISKENEVSIEKKTIEINWLHSKIEGMIEKSQNVEHQISLLGSSISSQGASINEYLENNKKDFAEKYENIILEAENYKLKTDTFSNRLKDIWTKINDFSITLEKNRVMMNEMTGQIHRLTEEKADYEAIYDESSKTTSKIIQISEKVNHCDDKLEELLRYLNIYLPKDIQVSISENIYAVLDKKTLLKYNRFEDQILKDLENNQIDKFIGLTEIIKRSIGGNLKMIKRHNDLKYAEEIARKLNKKRVSVRKKSEKSFFDEDVEESVKIITPTEKNIVTDPVLTSKVTVLSEENKKIRDEMSSNHSQTHLFLEIVRKEYENIKKRMEDYKEMFNKEIFVFSNFSSRFESDSAKLNIELNAIKTYCK